MSMEQLPRSVLITGASGNLGLKLVEALALTTWCERIVALDRTTDPDRFSRAALLKLVLVQADLSQNDGRWRETFHGVDAVIHFAAANPLPDSSLSEALVSCDMTVNVLRACSDHGVRRLVFASSNHAMGAYKDEPLVSLIGPGKLTSDLPPAPGTRWFNGTQQIHSLAYGQSKVLSEKICAAVAQASGGYLSCVSIRVGWALTGANDPRDITYAGAPSVERSHPAGDAEAQRNLRWFRDMWLSNRDLEGIFIAALTASGSDWPSSSVIVNGVSANAESVWDLEPGRRYLGFTPQDNVWSHLGTA